MFSVYEKCELCNVHEDLCVGRVGGKSVGLMYIGVGGVSVSCVLWMLDLYYPRNFSHLGNVFSVHDVLLKVR